MAPITITLAFALAATLALLMLATWRTGKTQPLQKSSGVYRHQLEELEQDVAAGKLVPHEAAEMRTEIARRLLAENDTIDRSLRRKPTPWLPLAFLLLVPAIAIPVYRLNGVPAQPDTPLAERLAQAEKNGDMDAMIAKVEIHLRTNPDDAKGWALLAPFYMQLGRAGDAAKAYETLLRLEPPSAERLASLGEALTYEAEATVMPAAAKAFAMALELEPSNPKAIYYSAIALKQAGNIDQARKTFEALLTESPADAPWRSNVERELASLAKAPALTAEQLALGKDMSTSQQGAMIRTMVEGLETRLKEDGGDIEGWLRLIRARAVLGDADQARSSLEKAKIIFAGNAQRQASLDALAKELKLQ